MNNWTGIGRLVRDPELRYTPGKGTPIAKVTIAIDNGYGENKKTDFIPVVIWGKQAENTAQYCTKGSLVAVEGRISTRTYEHDGVKKYAVEVSANLYGGIKFLSNKRSGDAGQPVAEANPFQNASFEDSMEPIDDGDMPF